MPGRERGEVVEDAEWSQLADLARRFYLEDESKTDLATRFSISRFRVARMLQQAREQGVVTIRVHDRAPDRAQMSQALAEHLALRECTVVPAEDSEEATRRVLARAAAGQLARHVRDGDLVGLSWGRTLVALAEEVDLLPPCTLVQLTGTVGTDITKSPIELVRRIAHRSGAETVGLFCPLFASTPAVASSWRADPAIARVLALHGDLHHAVLSLGSWDPPITQLQPYLTADDRAELDDQGACAELAGIFLRADGTPVTGTLDERRVSVSVDQLARAPRVLAVAGGVEKAPAIASAARSGLLTSLVTDDRTALALLRGPEVTSPVLRLHRELPAAAAH
ncbi:transcriptional regulator [Nocardioides sp. HDW12B]|uniref:sugar-binding transcriptional regulator n=1 Tax=Nocardioides sp. HDW12B TaxID=2714939 RepID=UPI00140D1EAE|nr:sugar-binding domain-containing protein [Nocardioides sp. HDW12B]QIK67352.1 transcriptional regulator [Nocardioides sp. HDW12B]